MTMTVKGRPDVVPLPTVDLILEEPGGRGRRRALVAVGVALIPILGLGAWWYLAEGPGAYTSVPAGLLDADLAEAESVLEDAGLQVVTVEEFHPTEPAGEVIAIDPGEGEDVRKDGTVTVTVSKGQDLRVVGTGGVGEPADIVLEALTTAGFAVTLSHEYSHTVPEGIVIRVTDEGGAPLAKGDTLPVGATILLAVSDGRQPVTVPSVVGMGKAEAVALLTAAGLQVVETQAYSPDVPAGVVKAQDPAGSTGVFAQDTVSIVVSLGPEPPPPPAPKTPSASVVIPTSVVGMTKFPALDLLASKGFDARYDRHTCTVDWAQCVVAYTVPAAGTSAAKGSVVTIWLANPAGAATSSAVIPSEVIGMQKHPALDLLFAKGFDARYERGSCTLEWSLCVVEYTVPAVGTSVPKGSAVTIWLRDPV